MYASVTINASASFLKDTYDYRIPEVLEGYISIGSRVLVDFGVRKTLGYVVEIKETCDFKGDIREISEVLDFSRELTEEQVDMAKKIAYDTKCPLIKALDAMIPSFLKTKYRKFISIKNFDSLDPNISVLFNGKKKICLTSEIVSKYPKIRKEIDKGNLELEYDVYSYGKKKYIKMYSVNVNCENIYSKYTCMRKKVVEYLISRKEATIDELKEIVGCSNYLVNDLVNKEVLNVKNVLQTIADDNNIKVPLQNRKFDFEKNLVKERFSQGNLTPYLLYTNDDDFSNELYLDICIDNIKNKKNVLIVTPTLIIQYNMYYYLKRHLSGYNIVNFSGDMPNSDYYNNYMAVKSGNADVVVTTKVGVFTPLDNIGTIIVIDESNFNYVSEMTPKYSVVEMMKYRAKINKAKIILSSTPLTIENYYKYFMMEYNLLKYIKPVNNNVTTVNMYEEAMNNRSIISLKLQKAIEKALFLNMQSMLVLNTRGYSNHLVCPKCGHIAKCDKCNIPVTYYKDKNEIKCRYCGKKLESLKCNKCGEDDYQMFGFGLEMVKEKLQELFPSAKILLIDSGTLKEFEDYQNAVVKIESGEVDIVIGTSNILALTNNTNNLDVVGILSIDNILNTSDYRASYNAFYMIYNALKNSDLIIQGYNLDHYAIKHAINSDFVSYYNDEIKYRENYNYPPFYELNKIIITGEYKNMYYCANYFKKAYATVFKSQDFVLGPTYVKIKKGVQLIIKNNDFEKLSKLIDEVEKKFEKNNIQISFERYTRSF